MNLVNKSISSWVNFECKHENNANDKRKKKTILKSIRVILVDQIVTSSRMSWKSSVIFSIAGMTLHVGDLSIRNKN